MPLADGRLLLRFDVEGEFPITLACARDQLAVLALVGDGANRSARSMEALTTFIFLRRGPTWVTATKTEFVVGRKLALALLELARYVVRGLIPPRGLTIDAKLHRYPGRGAGLGRGSTWRVDADAAVYLGKGGDR